MLETVRESGLYQEGLQWIERALEQSARAARRHPRWSARRCQDISPRSRTTYAWAALLVTEGLALARELGDHSWWPRCSPMPDLAIPAR